MRIENRLASLAEKIMVCSEKDRCYVENISTRAKVYNIPNVVNAKQGCMKNPGSSKNDLVQMLFVGTMSYDPNTDAMKYFCNEIYPLIKTKTEKVVKLNIVGFDPPDEINVLNKMDDITVIGGVDSVEPYYYESDFVIAPIRFGGGTRIKILEACSYGKAVVSTPLGCEGIELDPGEEILIGDTPEIFADMCISLINNPILRMKIEKSGMEKVKELYSDNALLLRYAEILHES